jgi:hypothetical protein
MSASAKQEMKESLENVMAENQFGKRAIINQTLRNYMRNLFHC